MNTRQLLIVLASLGAAGLSACASNAKIVRNLAVDDIYCDASDIRVEATDQHYAGITHYEAIGCGAKRNYVCEKWNKIVMASIGYIDFDPRRCRREMR